MTIEKFWEIIEQSAENIKNLDEQVEKVTKTLVALELEEIISFETHFNDRLSETYRWDIWAVAYIVNGGCSDDSFVYFRCWLIAQGRDFFETVLREPQKIAERVEDDEELELEPLLYSTYEAYEEKTGQKIPVSNATSSDYEPQGESWTEDDLERLYPDLWARFSNS